MRCKVFFTDRGEMVDYVPEVFEMGDMHVAEPTRPRPVVDGYRILDALEGHFIATPDPAYARGARPGEFLWS